MPTEMNAAQGEVYSVAVVIAEPAAFPEMRRGLMPTFRATLADTEQAIKEAVEDPGINRFCLTWTASAKARAVREGLLHGKPIAAVAAPAATR